MSSFDYSRIQQIYSDRRQEANEALILREQEIKRVIPELFSRRVNLRSEMAEAARKALKGTEPADFSKKIEKQKKWEQKALTEKGYPADYLDKQYFCPLCGDTGYVGDTLRTPCQCFNQLVLNQLCEASHMANLDQENFSTFNPLSIPETIIDNNGTTQREHLCSIKEKLEAYIDSFPKNDKTLVLFSGETGLGKSFLLNCIGKVLLDKGYSVVRVTAFQLMEWFSQSMFEQDIVDMLSPLTRADALILDDLGTEIIRRNSTRKYMYNLINQRLHERKHIFISTNLSMEKINETYSERFTSRLFGTSLAFRFIGDDIRMYTRQQ